jgi:hypothetical protein
VAHRREALCYPDVSDDARDPACRDLLLRWASLVKVAAGTADFSVRRDALAGAILRGRAYDAGGPGLHLGCDLTAASATSRRCAPTSAPQILPALLLPPPVLRAQGA